VGRESANAPNHHFDRDIGPGVFRRLRGAATG
jgi:hypothetical protein